MTEDELYWRDALAWSERQADLLRRIARGERVNDVDWPHVIDEIEDVGISELNAVRSLLRQALVHLLKAHAWPNDTACQHWRIEIAGFLDDAAARFAPSMRQRLDIDDLWRRACKQVDQTIMGDRPPGPLPDACPFTIDDLLAADRERLEQRLAAAAPA